MGSVPSHVRGRWWCCAVHRRSNSLPCVSRREKPRAAWRKQKTKRRERDREEAERFGESAGRHKQSKEDEEKEVDALPGGPFVCGVAARDCKRWKSNIDRDEEAIENRIVREGRS